jgi:hypothetical protein
MQLSLRRLISLIDWSRFQIPVEGLGLTPAKRAISVTDYGWCWSGGRATDPQQPGLGGCTVSAED